MANSFESFLAPQMEQYLEYRESLGYSATSVKSLRLLDRYMVTEHVTTFNALTSLFFLKMRTDLAIGRNTINRVIYALRGFFQYLVRIESCQYNPLAGIPRFKENNIIPFIFSDQETEQLLEAAWRQVRREKQAFFLKDMSCCMALQLLARCGLRISEPLRLKVKDFRADERTIYIRKTKFRKDRLIPIPMDVANHLSEYLLLRNTLLLTDTQSPYLLIGSPAKGLHNQQVRNFFHRATREIGLAQPKQVIGNTNISGTTPHSLRHSFAVNTLRRVKERGDSPQSALAVLAVYMGHKKYTYTIYYLKLIDADQRRNLVDFMTMYPSKL
ncbi:tyrosine-type recombinase/integrase [Desulfogranum marinum]|uniref:tyrosine-type recombinase/integrase n=1 Tax=Desulfogranum marinum TaxID=453220 RepID=UPI001964BC63|nr:tyrosine-type recombinase/integrase [Desulfogranum marinum]MBM9515248.1 tyrosine-type recombinase/integrase [Desulfogranum marinum]